jgi:hypothetical protein
MVDQLNLIVEHWEKETAQITDAINSEVAVLVKTCYL